MQHAKDTFYIALRERLAAVNPGRTVVVNGVTRPAVVVVENEPPTSAPPLPGAFYLRWGAARLVQGAACAPHPLMAVACAIAYAAAGSTDAATDRGRALAALDLELLRMCAPPRAQKYDHTCSPPAPLGTMVFWSAPEFDDPEVPHIPAGNAGRIARLTLFFYPEVDTA